MKRVVDIYAAAPQHWVGDGFPVRSLMSYQTQVAQQSPFLLLDYAGPTDFPPAERPRGVGEHPHRGFETVTLVYQGEIAHRDSTGQGGLIGPGDVQWMTAGAGILHEEFHSPAFTRTGGPLEMVQLWVNLPAEHKMTEPGYQAITAADIPTVQLPDQAGQLRVIAGDYAGHTGPAKTFTPMAVWDLQIRAGSRLALPIPSGWNASLVILEGGLSVNDTPVSAVQRVVLSSDGDRIRLQASEDTRLLLLAGQPIDEPVVGYGPFVMNSRQEIAEAIEDFNRGRFGKSHSRTRGN